jgi:diacylglycerol diphosphate phosphatase / phosphatidate phosphatase
VVLVPTLGAALIAISRIEDARHHPFDVITGSLLGALCAYISYRQYFPPLGDSWKKGRAYPIRSWATQPTGPTDAQAEREYERDTGREPLRSAPLPTNENEYVNQSSTNYTGSNVFRAQVASSGRLRESEYSNRRWVDGRGHSRDNSDTPLSGPAYNARPARGHDEFSDGMSEDGEEFELQPTRGQQVIVEDQSHHDTLGGAPHS